MPDTATAPPQAARVLDTFRRVVETMPWYRELLAERGVRADDVRSLDDFSRLCPILTKQNTFARFAVSALAATTSIRDLASVLTSSGHSGRFSFGLATRAQEAAGADQIDDALDAAFAVRTRPTLAINCLPMGVVFSSRCMTVATTSVREDMAVALVETFGSAYAQVLLVTDPLFMKRLTDHARERGLEWRNLRMQAVVGEEVFGEHFRHYVADRLGLGREGEPETFLMSSFGVGELGLHLCYETRATVALRRLVHVHPCLAPELLGPSASLAGLPMFFTHDERRTWVEIDEPDADGFGRLTISMLDPTLPIPLLRYQTGDVARRLDADTVAGLLARHGLSLPQTLPAALIALRGREREALPNGTHVGIYKDALYADPELADRLTGAMRITLKSRAATMHVQLVAGATDDRGVATRLRDLLPSPARPREVSVWRYEAFPFGMTLDYERKFVGVQAP